MLKAFLHLRPMQPNLSQVCYSHQSVLGADFINCTRRMPFEVLIVIFGQVTCPQCH